MPSPTSSGFRPMLRTFLRAPLAWTRLLLGARLVRLGDKMVKRGAAKLKALGIGIPPL